MPWLCLGLAALGHCCASARARKGLGRRGWRTWVGGVGVQGRQCLLILCAAGACGAHVRAGKGLHRQAGRGRHMQALEHQMCMTACKQQPAAAAGSWRGALGGKTQMQTFVHMGLGRHSPARDSLTSSFLKNVLIFWLNSTLTLKAWRAEMVGLRTFVQFMKVTPRERSVNPPPVLLGGGHAAKDLGHFGRGVDSRNQGVEHPPGL